MADGEQEQGRGCTPGRRRVVMPEDPGHPIDRIIREAMARGEFDNLPGRGKPLPVEPPGNPRAPAFRILRNAGFAPEWVDLERAIEAARAEADAALAEYAARREAAIAELRALLAEAAGAVPARRRGWLARRAGGRAARARLTARVAAAVEAVNASAERACRARLERLHALNRMIDRVNLIHPARGCQHAREDVGRAAAEFVERFPRLLLVREPDAPPALQYVPWEAPAAWLQPPPEAEEPLPHRVRGEVQVDALVEYRRRQRSGKP